jgi:hypothetical protein
MLAYLFAQPYVSPPDYNTAELLPKTDILLPQQSAIIEYEQCQQSNATDHQYVLPQQVDAGGMRIMINALWIS